MMNMDKHKEAFLEEAYELLAELEHALLELEESPDDQELIGRVFRAMHTLKGSGAMFGFDELAAFTHDIETAFDHVRNGKLPVTKELIDLTLSARDHIRMMLDTSGASGGKDKAKGDALIASFRKLISLEDAFAVGQSQAGTDPDKGGLDSTNGKQVTYRIRFRPPSDIGSRGINPSYLLDDLNQLGNCRVVAQVNDIPDLEDLDTETCYTFWDIILTTGKGIDAIKDIFIFIEDDSEVRIDVIDEEDKLDNEAGYKNLGEILIERGDLSPKDLQRVLKEKKLIGEMLVEAGVANPYQIESALLEQQHIKEIRERRRSSDSVSSIRVPSEKLDKLVDLLGELVTAQSLLSQTAVDEKNPRFLGIAEEVERLVTELRDNTMSIRMMPIGTTFSKFKRLVRDLSNELGKEIELTTDGAETELDKTVIEKLNDPLVHIIRNSIDHGIEPPEIRMAKGRPGRGTVHLSAIHSGANVLIKIEDDGRGLDAGGIRQKAIEKGLIQPDSELSEKELFALIFAPGFSTAEKVTNVSGRGVGMDVVKRAIDALRGTIDVSSRKDLGTTITLKLPLTLAIIEGLLVKIGGESFIAPLSVVEECVELTREDVARAHGRHLAHVRGQIVPYIRLREHFMINGDSPEIEQIVIADVEGNRVGLVVDNVIGEHQTVIKSLGTVYRTIEGISGATLLGDGTVALILDIPKLVHMVTLEEMAQY
jgi:two-component system, chemotaxis family, sensor kinase CheA